MASLSSSRRSFAGRGWLGAACVAAGLALAGCRTADSAGSPSGEAGASPAYRPAVAIAGDEIVVAGRRFHTGTRVITWRDRGGYDAYAGAPPPALRRSSLPAAEQKRIREHGWKLPQLQQVVDQFVLHYDVCGVSKVCFKVLHDRGLNVHFLLDVDGTIYQTLDLQERASHATISNDRSIGIEIANIGAYPPGATQPLDAWYRRDSAGGTVLTIPARLAEPGIFTPHFAGRPARAIPIRGAIQGHPLVQYDFTPEQYAALTKLTAALCRVFPRIRCDYPHDANDRLITHKLPDPELAAFHGILGHYHVQANKDDPGPAFAWKSFIAAVRRELR